MTNRKIIIVGGREAGLMATGQAAAGGAKTLVLEKMKRTGRKLCITGKGRCNITNIAEISDFIDHFGKTGCFLRQAFTGFSNTDLMDFFTGLGLELLTERGGRVFPSSSRAQDVLDTLLQWCGRCGVQIRHTRKVDTLIIRKNRIKGVVCGGKEFPCDTVILTTGGASYPATGSTGDGYRLVETAGHNVVPVRPALVPLETAGDMSKKLAGLTLRNVRANMYVNGKKRREAFGELLFMEFGLSGPVILTISGDVVDAIQKGHTVSISIDLKPALDEKKLEARLLRDFSSRGREPFKSLLRGLLPREMVPVCLGLTNISPDQTGSAVTVKERRRLHSWLKDIRLEITGYRPFTEAIITAGGVNTKEVDPRTMASRLTKGLFMAGELLDIQADTGGYNLQAAFSTGWLAGRSAASGTD